MNKEKCDKCGKKIINLDLHMRRYHPHGEESKLGNEREIPSSYVEVDKKVNELDGKITNLTELMVQLAETVKDLTHPIVYKTESGLSGTADLSKIKESIPQPIQSTDDELAKGQEKIPVPPSWRKMVDEILGMDFGIDVVYPQSGSGFLFKIIVPTEKSNMSQDYKDFYKVDVRTKAVNYNDGIEGIRKFCEQVKNNLETKKS